MLTSFFSLNTLVIIGIIASAAASVMCKKTLSSVIALGITGAFIGLEFMLLNAPDVALSEVAVGAVLTTAIFIIAIRKTTSKEDSE